jgi:hypothetical protein
VALSEDPDLAAAICAQEFVGTEVLIGSGAFRPA